MKKCEYCKKNHNGEYGSRRFCSVVCARGFSTSQDRKEISRKVSLTLSKGETKQQKIQRKYAERHASYIRETNITSLLELSKRKMWME